MPYQGPYYLYTIPRDNTTPPTLFAQVLITSDAGQDKAMLKMANSEQVDELVMNGTGLEGIDNEKGDLNISLTPIWLKWYKLISKLLKQSILLAVG